MLSVRSSDGRGLFEIGVEVIRARQLSDQRDVTRDCLVPTPGELVPTAPLSAFEAYEADGPSTSAKVLNLSGQPLSHIQAAATHSTPEPASPLAATPKNPPPRRHSNAVRGATMREGLLACLEFAAIGGAVAGFIYLQWSTGTSALDLTIWIIVLIAAATSSIAGFAFAGIAGAMLFHVTPDKVYVLQVILIASIGLQSYCVWKLRRSIEPRLLATYFVGGVMTILPGVYLFLYTPIAFYFVALGVFLVSYASFILTRPPLRISRDSALRRFAAGALGGITGATAGFPGAFVTIWCGAQGWGKERQRAVYQPFILGMQVLTISALAMVHPGPVIRLEVAKFVVPAVLGAYIGLRIFERLSTGQFNRVVGFFLLISGALLMLKGLML